MTHHFAPATTFQAMIPFGIVKPPFLGCCFSSLTSKALEECANLTHFRESHMVGKTEATLCVCGNTCVETATPGKCVHLFVAQWGHTHSDNQPPAILRLERRQLANGAGASQSSPIAEAP